MIKENRRESRNYWKDKKFGWFFSRLEAFNSLLWNLSCLRASGYRHSAENGGIICWSSPSQVREKEVSLQGLQVLSAPSQCSWLKKGEGEKTGDGVSSWGSDTACFSLLLIPFPSQQIVAGLGRNRSPGAVGGRGMGQSIKGNGPWPKAGVGGRTQPSPLQFPTEFTAQQIPLVQQLYLEVYWVQGPKGQVCVEHLEGN